MSSRGIELQISLEWLKAGLKYDIQQAFLESLSQHLKRNNLHQLDDLGNPWTKQNQGEFKVAYSGSHHSYFIFTSWDGVLCYEK